MTLCHTFPIPPPFFPFSLFSLNQNLYFTCSIDTLSISPPPSQLRNRPVESIEFFHHFDYHIRTKFPKIRQQLQFNDTSIINKFVIREWWRCREKSRWKGGRVGGIIGTRGGEGRINVGQRVNLFRPSEIRLL